MQLTHLLRVAAVPVALAAACGKRPDDSSYDALDGPPGQGAPGPAFDAGEPQRRRATGTSCFSAAECTGGMCIRTGSPWSLCSNACASDNDCPADGSMRCGVGVGGQKQCLPPCGNVGIVCVDGAPVVCAEADDSHCAQCGCEEGLFCQPEVGCQPRREVDERCERDEECKSSNCSPTASVCRVGAGQPCTALNCDSCLQVLPHITPFCDRPCETDMDCNGLVCTSQGCRPRCRLTDDDPCPSQRCGSELRTTYTSPTAEPIVWGTAHFCKCGPEGCGVLTTNR